jgi:hypothetical protein
MPEKNNWIVLTKGGKLFPIRDFKLSDDMSYTDVLEVLGQSTRDMADMHGLPHALILNGQLVVAADFFSICERYVDQRRKARLEADEKVREAFPMPEPKPLT